MQKKVVIIKDDMQVEYTIPALNGRVLVDLCTESKCNARCEECIIKELAKQIGIDHIFG